MGEQLIRCEAARSPGGKLEREWKAVEPAAISATALLVPRTSAVRAGLQRAFLEEGYGVRFRKRLDRVDMLAGEMQDDSARHQQRQPRRLCQQLDVERRGVAQMLGVVEDEQQLLRSRTVSTIASSGCRPGSSGTPSARAIVAATSLDLEAPRAGRTRRRSRSRSRPRALPRERAVSCPVPPAPLSTSSRTSSRSRSA